MYRDNKMCWSGLNCNSPGRGARDKSGSEGRPVRNRLEVNYGAHTDLDVILRAGIEPGVHVVGFGAQSDARIVGPVNAATGLNRYAVLALPSDLGI